MDALTAILSALIPQTKDKSERVDASSSIRKFKQHIKVSELPEEFQFIAKVAINYHDQYNSGTLDEDIYEAVVKKSNKPEKEQISLLAQFFNLKQNHVPFDKFQFYLESYLKQQEANFLAEKQTFAMLALEKGFTDPSTKIKYEGPTGAKLILQQALYENPYQQFNNRFQQGDIRDDAEDILQEYDNRKHSVEGVSEIYTGHKDIDRQTGGFKKTDLILIGGFTAHGKSIEAVNIAHYNMMNGKNGIIFTAETSRSVYRRRVLARHSCVPTVGRIQGLDSRKIKDATLEKDEEIIFLKVVKDITSNPTYGILHIEQVSRDTTIRTIIDKAEELNKQFYVDYVIIDYLELLSPSRRRNSRREEIEDMLLETKQFALTFDNGRGTVVIDLHQMKQEAAKKVKAQDDKFYDISDFSNTSEAGKSADVAYALLYNDELRQAKELAVKVLKNRDGDLEPMFKLFANFASSYIGDLSS